MSVIAGAIMSVVFDNKEHPEYQNLTNVYSFISEMCRTVGQTMPINKYIENYKTTIMLIPSLVSFNLPTLWYINHTFKRK